MLWFGRWSVLFVPCLVRASQDGGRVPRLGHRLLDDYLDMVAARARPNTVLATAFDLKVFFSVVGKDAGGGHRVRTCCRSSPSQRQPRRGATVVRIEDGEAGLSARTIKRRLASVTGLFEYLIVRGVVAKNPVPHGLSTRSPNRGRAVPLIRTPRTLPRVIDPDEADALLAALRTHRDRAMVQAMLLGGLRRCEVLGLRLGDVHPGREAAVHRRRQGRASADRAGLTALLHHLGRLPGAGAAAHRRRRIACSSCSRANVVDGR